MTCCCSMCWQKHRKRKVFCLGRISNTVAYFIQQKLNHAYHFMLMASMCANLLYLLQQYIVHNAMLKNICLNLEICHSCFLEFHHCKRNFKISVCSHVNMQLHFANWKFIYLGLRHILGRDMKLFCLYNLHKKKKN